MDNEQIERQKELFEEFQKPEKTFKFFKSSNKLLQNKLFILQFTFEKAVFLSIGLVIIFIIVFCFGVERGKCIAGYKKTIVVQNIIAPATSSSKNIKAPEVPVPSAIQPAAVLNTGIFRGGSQRVDEKGYVYKIRIASYINKNFAEKDLQKIKQMGFPAYMAKSGKYFAIYVGDYNNKAAAESALSALRKKYSGISIKTVKK